VKSKVDVRLVPQAVKFGRRYHVLDTRSYPVASRTNKASILPSRTSPDTTRQVKTSTSCLLLLLPPSQPSPKWNPFHIGVRTPVAWIALTLDPPFLDTLSALQAIGSRIQRPWGKDTPLSKWSRLAKVSS